MVKNDINFISIREGFLKYVIFSFLELEYHKWTLDVINK